MIAVLVGQGGSLIEPLRVPGAVARAPAPGVVAAGISSLLFLTAIRSIGGTRTGIS